MVTLEDLYTYEYECNKPNFEEHVVSRRESARPDDVELVDTIASQASESCFGTPRRCHSDQHGEVVEVCLYGTNIDVKAVQTFVRNRSNIRIGNMVMLDDGWEPAHLRLTIVDHDDGEVWA